MWGCKRGGVEPTRETVERKEKLWGDNRCTGEMELDLGG